MNEQQVNSQPFTVSVEERPESQGELVFTFTYPSQTTSHTDNGKSLRQAQYVVVVSRNSKSENFDWSENEIDPGLMRAVIEAEIAARMSDRAMWIDRVKALVADVERWAMELGWSTRRIEKKLDDERIGRHRVPALLMQEETCRIILEPLGRSSPGTEGIVDLYLMPAYDDIARLYYSDDRWNVHYLSEGSESADVVQEAEDVPLSKETLAKVLAELRQHAA